MYKMTNIMVLMHYSESFKNLNCATAGKYFSFYKLYSFKKGLI